MREKDVEQAIYSYIAANWTDTPLLLEANQYDVSTSQWLQVRIMQIKKNPTRRDFEIYNAEINFSLFNNDLDNIYSLGDYVDKLSNFLENKTIFVAPYKITFKEFDVTFLQKDDPVDIKKIVNYRSIFCSVVIEKE